MLINASLATRNLEDPVTCRSAAVSKMGYVAALTQCLLDFHIAVTQPFHIYIRKKRDLLLLFFLLL